ncbi:Uncharacterised protein [Paenibacillus macerans]|uniref:Uncharacterized protein n=1 Tax=Paenibacillus macerans TaxID=44252 RepID=A0A090ZM29_PAEMA|nr:hypothetical protein DJ90_6237 [Paenibacillus macerans]SUA85991.1 Uncharacterised protein [Paenibacillus macerans]
MDKTRLPRNLGEKDKNKKCPYFGDITHFEYNRGILCRYFSNRKEIPAVWTIRRYIRTKISVNGDEHFWLQKIRT